MGTNWASSLGTEGWSEVGMTWDLGDSLGRTGAPWVLWSGCRRRGSKERAEWNSLGAGGGTGIQGTSCWGGWDGNTLGAVVRTGMEGTRAA